MSVRGVTRTQEPENTGRLDRRAALRESVTTPRELSVHDVQHEVPSAAPLQATTANTRTAVSPNVLRRRQVIADMTAVMAGVISGCALVGVPTEGYSLGPTIWIAVVSGLAWMTFLGMNRLYMARAVARPSEELQRIAFAGLMATGCTVVLSSLTGVGSPDRWFGVSFATVTGLLVVERLLARLAFNRMRAAGSLRRRVAIIGTDRNAQALYHSVAEQPELGYEVVGYIATNRARNQAAQEPIIGHVSGAEQALRDLNCVGVLISLNSVNGAQVNRLARELTDAGFHVALSTSLHDFDATRLRPQAIGEQTLVYLEPTIREGWRSHAKRVFDIVLASTGIVLTAPIVALAAVAIRLDSKGPVFFRQVRVGRDGAEFEMIKLRTMTADAETRRAEVEALNERDGALFKVADDPRVTRVGRFLRRTSIDEVPQFWNVLRGHMSMVGPRPALPSEVAGWDVQLRERLRVLPGLTGAWQVSGRSSPSFAEYRRLDLSYVDNWSLRHDIRIVLKTFAVVVLQRGAS